MPSLSTRCEYRESSQARRVVSLPADEADPRFKLPAPRGILRQAGIAFEVFTAPVDESRGAGEPPVAYVRRLAEAKVRAVAEGATAAQAPAWAVGADTVVLIDDLVLGKPASAAEARRMLELLSGRTHEVLTGVAVLRLPEGAAQVEQESTKVTLAPLCKEEIEDYIATGEPFGKAGAYAFRDARAGSSHASKDATSTS